MLRFSKHLLNGSFVLAAVLTVHPVTADAAPARSKRQVRVEIAAVVQTSRFQSAKLQPTRSQPSRAQPVQQPVIASGPAPVRVPPVAVVSLGAQTLTVYSGTDIIAQTPISSGMET